MVAMEYLTIAKYKQHGIEQGCRINGCFFETDFFKDFRFLILLLWFTVYGLLSVALFSLFVLFLNRNLKTQIVKTSTEPLAPSSSPWSQFSEQFPVHFGSA